MGEYVDESISKTRFSESKAHQALTQRPKGGGGRELRHGEWISNARSTLERKPFGEPTFGLLLIFTLLFVGSVFLFENLDILTGSLYAIKISISSLFAISLGVIMSTWWRTTTRFEDRLKEAARIDAEYRELLLSFSDSLFDIVNALNTLAEKPPRPFIVATEFMLGEYVHLLQSQLQRYGDNIAGLGFDATDFLDEKIRIFEGIRERAGVAIQGMPKEVENLFADGLSLSSERLRDISAQRKQRLRSKLEELSGSESQAAPRAPE
jgi:hypothetical protein